MRRLLNKKGDVFQIFFVLIILFTIAIVGLLFGTLAFKFTGAIHSSGILAPSPQAEAANTIMNTSSWSVGEEFIFFFFLGSNIALLIAASRTNFSPTIIFLFVLLLLMAILIASGLVNIYQGFAHDAMLQDYTVHQVITNALLSKYFPLIISVVGAVILIIMYGKNGSDIAP